MLNLVMCCTPIGREQTFDRELHYAVLAAQSFKRLYPQAQVFMATTPDASMPSWIDINVLPFDFREHPLQISRQLFYAAFCRSDLFTAQTVFAGTDVLWGNKAWPQLQDYKMMVSYRNHPSQPYCSDLVVVKDAEFGAEFFKNLVRMVPKKDLWGWTDQIAMVIEIGKLPESDFDGKIHRSQRHPDILLVPEDEYLYVPNGYVAPKQALELLDAKYAIHFKGTRKPWFMEFENERLAA